MKLVSILLRFTRAIREGNWELPLLSFSEMLPWFVAFDHVNYTRRELFSWRKLLPRSVPEVYQGCTRGVPGVSAWRLRDEGDEKYFQPDC